MARINTNVAALVAQRGLAQSQATLSSTLQRLSTGLKINSGADDPAGLIASEGLRSEIQGINSAISNSSQASNVLATAEGALNEVASLLLNIKDLVVQNANAGVLSQDEIAANQLQINSAIDSITRISNSTSFAGLKLLDGNLDYVTSGLAASAISDLEIDQANFGTAGNIPVNISVVTSAQPGALTYAGSAVTSGATLEVRGDLGVVVIPISAGATVSSVVAQVNAQSSVTGVTASLLNANPISGIVFNSVDSGSKNFVQVTAQPGSKPFAVKDNAGNTTQRSYGVDVQATINGALTTGDGNSLNLNTAALNMQLTLTPAMIAGKTTSFTITGGGAAFQLGPQVDANQQVNIGIQSIASTHLGNSTVGFLNQVEGTGSGAAVSAQQASQIVEAAINQVAVLRGRLGAFEKNVIQTNVNSLQIALENVTSSESDIRDADFAQETSNLTRAQILTQAGTSVLATANSTPQSVLTLLQGH